MKFVKTFEDWDQVSPELKAHIDEGLNLRNSFFRLGSEAEYWDKDNIILKGPEAWMAKNLEVGKDAVYKPRGSKAKKVKLDSPERGGNKKFIVYRNSGRKDEEGNILAKKIEWGDPKLSVKNDDPSAAASFWARHQCDLKKKMDPDKAGFWACYSSVLFSKQLGLKSDQPW
jgi:hypothetical protein